VIRLKAKKISILWHIIKQSNKLQPKYINIQHCATCRLLSCNLLLATVIDGVSEDRTENQHEDEDESENEDEDEYEDQATLGVGNLAY